MSSCNSDRLFFFSTFYILLQLYPPSPPQEMYTVYVRKSQHTSLLTLDTLTYMRVSMAELYTLDPKLTYHHTYTYVTQIHSLVQRALLCPTQVRCWAIGYRRA